MKYLNNSFTILNLNGHLCVFTCNIDESLILMTTTMLFAMI